VNAFSVIAHSRLTQPDQPSSDLHDFTSGKPTDILVQSKRDKQVAKKFFRKLLKNLRYVPRAIITDKLRSYNTVKAEALPGVEHHQQKYRNNRAENSHQPTRLRERIMKAIQVSRTRTTFSLRVRNYWLTLSSRETSVQRRRLPSGEEVEMGQLGRCDRCLEHKLITRS